MQATQNTEKEQGKMTTTLIQDGQLLTGAKSEFGRDIPVYDDGFGPLFIHRNSIGISGIVRAQTWEDAYGICEDEFFPSPSETLAEIVAEYGENWSEDDCWNEQFGFRNNASADGSTIYVKDLNGDSLDVLTPELLAKLGITLKIEGWEAA